VLPAPGERPVPGVTRTCALASPRGCR